MTAGRSAGFSAAQEERLRKLELLPEQIAALAETLPSCRAMLRKPASMTEVREKLRSVVKALHQARKITAGSSLASVEARNRLELSAAEIAIVQIEAWSKLDPTTAATVPPPPNPGSEPDILVRLQYLLDISEKALRNLPQAQRRPNDASPLPIERIESALLQGFVKHHGTGPFPAYMVRTSVTKPPFPEIAAIFYEAIGATTEVPERAIKSYIALKKRLSRRKTNVKTVSLIERRLTKKA